MLKVGQHLVTFDDHMHRGGGDIMVLACHVISQDHVIKSSRGFISKSPFKGVTILPSLVAKSTVVIEI